MGHPRERWAHEICAQHGLVLREELRRTTHDLSTELRNLIWDVERDGRRAVLKVYDIRGAFKDRALHWGHGHFKANDLFVHEDGRWTITDFGHTKMLPEGYEEALVIWWDQMVSVAPADYDRWRAAIDDWARRFLDAVPELHRDLLLASVLERALATVLESIALADDMAPQERRDRLERQYRLIDELSSAATSGAGAGRRGARR